MSLKQIKVELCSSWGGDRQSADAAWASSFSKDVAEAKSDSDVAKLITGVVKLHHDTPKERTWLEFFMTFPIFVERQYDKYRMTIQFQQFAVEYFLGPMGRLAITQNELSGRYRTIPDRPYDLPTDVDLILRKADRHELLPFEYGQLLEKQHRWYGMALETMREAEKAGRITNAEYKRAREVIRGVLGTSFLTDMRIVMNMNAFEHIVNQRLAPEAQLESRVAARAMVHAVEASGRLPVMIQQMIETNGWAPLLAEVAAALEKDT